MREAQFLKNHAEKWKLYEQEIKLHEHSDQLADRFIEITDDLSYSKTFFPQTNTTKYLNGLAALFHLKIYKNKKETTGRIWNFWQYELPFLFRLYHRQFLYAFIFFITFPSQYNFFFPVVCFYLSIIFFIIGFSFSILSNNQQHDAVSDFYSCEVFT